MQESARRKLLEYKKLYEEWRIASKAAEEAELSILRDEMGARPIESQRRIEAATLAADARRLQHAAMKARPD